MNFIVSLVLRLLLVAAIAYLITPIGRRFSLFIKAVDYPNARRLNKKPMPSAGGLTIYITFIITTLFIFPDVIPKDYALKIILSSGIVVITGILDDIFELSPKQKLLGITLGALSAYYIADIRMNTVSLFSFFDINLGFLSLPLTLIWIIALTNAINLIDGLDGLASGVSIIALMSMGIVGYISVASYGVIIQVPIMIFILVACTVGFLPFNFYPAKIYLGDTGALFLGFMIAILSLQGLKNTTVISLITPLIILGVPITDTLFAIIRRLLNKQPISSADKMHLHHRLLSIGFTHRGAVLMIYALAFIFSFIAILYSFSDMWANIIMTIALLFGLELFVELIGLTGTERQPLMDALKFIGNRAYRIERLEKRKKKNKHSK
ncbi:undecaprenyl/decaprenyl-phosphate alpha-N-acetylglucosaminyl 1-phosphate transferase [Vagococcus sp. PNs007]|uniref:Undecaprenyl/decaprenyl-phosphate alpha-N-acetylglucosaminyl 1-phosphate transferase n=1 Tax=Vagococcus proximus TaxID=2991417 RepID=A0ABT5X0C1_9ENTE|nr:MraY family glycosyltransferase [Vagococcus proximus]MDF0479321.1 undecaprenyl/decaprenyl-phosphate alpha-N-acetylglucosaminyl 1-phosphate transferase [Vagococcus proximus]